MRVSELHPSKYITEADLAGKPRIMVMRNLEFEEVGQQRDRKPVLYFEKAQKGLVVNKTNTNKIAGIYGPDTDDWMGHPIELYPSETDFQGETVPCIRVRAPKSNGAATAAKTAPHHRDPEPPAHGASDIIDDEIPF